MTHRHLSVRCPYQGTATDGPRWDCQCHPDEIEPPIPQPKGTVSARVRLGLDRKPEGEP